jgi:signal transduction histidine kinase
VAILLQEITSSLLIPQGFDVQVNSPMPVLETEEIYLRQIFTNLIDNAIKYHDQSVGKIEISAKSHKTFYEFKVKDDGPGIAEKYHEKIFKMYYSLNTSASKDSTGLGLSIIKKITSEKGGKVWVESRGRGTSFIFTWPAQTL